VEVTIVGFGVMREYLPDAPAGSAPVEVDGSTVRDLLAELGVPERLVHMCLVDGRRVGLDEGLREGSEVTLMPPFSGGANS
jgi:molybdopterin converting factor small subunit